MFTLGQKKSFGIDIGTQTIKIVEISNNNNNFSIDNYSIWDDDINNVIQQKDSDVALSSQTITNIISVMLSHAGMKISEAYIALPSYLALFSMITMPILEPEELNSAIPLEAKRHIPVPLDTVQLDWINLGKNKNQSQYDILLIALPDTIVSRYMEVSKALNIKIKGFELDCFSTLRSISLPKEQVCVIDIGARTSTVMVVNSDKKLQAIQSFDFGGNHITEAIAELKNISIIDAENLKKQNGIVGNDAQVVDLVQSRLKSFIENDVFRLLKNIDYQMDFKINSIVVLGGVSKMEGIEEYISFLWKNNFENQNINISIANSIPNLTVKGMSDIKAASNLWQDLILSMGVALKNYID
jgi:type IV pilus assembly protein PilM